MSMLEGSLGWRASGDFTSGPRVGQHIDDLFKDDGDGHLLATCVSVQPYVLNLTD